MDSKLIEHLKAGDSHALKIFFDTFYHSVCVYAIKFIKQKDVSEDIVQEAFLKYWNIRKQINDIKSAKAFIYKTVRNSCINYIKQKNLHDSIHKKELIETDISYELIIEEETYRILHEAIKSLPPRMQEIITCSLQGNKNNEIAEQLGISINTVKTLKKNAYKELRIKLQGHVFILFLLNQLLNY
jgi:RNA polymerase sigma-70 factor (family 1)